MKLKFSAVALSLALVSASAFGMNRSDREDRENMEGMQEDLKALYAPLGRGEVFSVAEARNIARRAGELKEQAQYFAQQKPGRYTLSVNYARYVQDQALQKERQLRDMGVDF